MDKHMQNEKELIRLRRFLPAAGTFVTVDCLTPSRHKEGDMYDS